MKAVLSVDETERGIFYKGKKEFNIYYEGLIDLSVNYDDVSAKFQDIKRLVLNQLGLHLNEKFQDIEEYAAFLENGD